MVPYLIQVALVFSILYILYLVFLNKLTFYTINRFVLVALLPVSIILPLFNNLFPVLSSKIIEVPSFIPIHIDTTAIDQQLFAVEQPLLESYFQYNIIIGTIYWIVFSIYILRILISARKLIVLKNRSILQKKEGYQLVIAQVPQIFSYFNWVFIPEHKFNTCDNQVLEHEKTHIRLKHSWDVILIELYIACFWFNPLLYYYRKSLKSIHEFQADKGVLEKGVKTSQYMQLLLENLEITKSNNLYNYFNQSILKKRITMMTKTKSNRIKQLRYILFLPVCAFLISAFSSPGVEHTEYLNIPDMEDSLSTPPSLFPIQNATKSDITSFFGVVRKHPKLTKNIKHRGIDIRAKIGTPVLATADGIISKAAMEGDWGNLMVITHADGYETWYAHLNGFKAVENQKVKKGDVIGYVGTTGLSTGPHLHYEVKQNEKNLNPLDYM
ncbi:M23/M56 family metallopeptidase [Aquimarina sp. AU474]|uniref:M23/M56 family metallopeptidase n=1 Tax=Aquimarina sp. AU474 TaxID=2108529 RepID=UPI000D6866A8|nr:M23/M56 family metallopeptidase [Aquimarina sp. AU474]